jgi:hypothetical protein
MPGLPMNRTHIAGFTMFLLAACGGGGGDSVPATTPPAGGGATEVAYSFNLPGGGSTSSAVLAQ